MMISPFINTSRQCMLLKILFIISVFFSCDAFSNHEKQFILPDKSGFIFWKCHSNLCDIFLKKKDINAELILKNSPSPSINILNKNLVQLFFSCGSPCNYSIFYDPNKGFSRSFEFVVAVNIKKKQVVVAENNKLAIYKIFASTKTPIFHITRNWSPTATLFSAILDAKFIDKSLSIKYLEGKNFNTKTEVLNI